MAQVGTGASNVTIEEEAPSTPQVQGVPTAIAGFVGIAARGPIGKPTRLTSFEDFRRIFGGDITNGYLSHAVRGFFKEGGQDCYVVRTVHYTDLDVFTSKTSTAALRQLLTGNTAPAPATLLGTNVEPFQLEPGLDLRIPVDGAGAVIATFSATFASVVTSGAGPFALTAGMNLQLSVNGGGVVNLVFQSGEFANIAAATRAELAASLNSKLAGAAALDITTGVRLRTDRYGTSASINVVGGTANAVLGFVTGPVLGTGNVEDITEVTAAEVKAVVEAAIPACTVTAVAGAVRISSNTAGPSSNIQVTPASTAREELGLDTAVHTGSSGAAQATFNVRARYDGEYANRIRPRIMPATNGVAADFNLQLLDDGVQAGTFPDLSMDPTSPRYVETVVNDEQTGSPLVLVEDLGLPGTAAARRPADGTFVALAGGSDGLVGLGDTDFIGSKTGKTGIFALNSAQDISLLVVSDRPTASVHNAMLAYCEVERGGSVFAILDPPANMTAEGIITYVQTTATLLGASEFAAIYWPRVEVSNPAKLVYGSAERIVVPPAGLVAGLYARVDASTQGGQYQPPAGTQRGRLTSVLGFETEEALSQEKMNLVYPKLINPLTSSSSGPYVNGVRTLKAGGNFPTVAERRGVIFINTSLKAGTDFVRFRNNDEALRAELRRVIEAFLLAQMRIGAFRSTDPAKAFFVDTGPAINPDSLIFKGIVRARYGVATQKPAEFVHLLVSQVTAEAQSAS